MTENAPPRDELPKWLVGATALGVLALVLVLVFAFGPGSNGSRTSGEATDRLVSAVNGYSADSVTGITCTGFIGALRTFTDQAQKTKEKVRATALTGSGNTRRARLVPIGGTGETLAFSVRKKDGSWTICT